MNLDKGVPAIRENRSFRERALGALSALYILAAGMPGITLPAQAQENFSPSYGAADLFNVDPKMEAKRRQGQDVLRKSLDSQPKEVEAKMHELLALGPECREKVDKKKLFAMPGAKEMYDRLSEVFMKYNWYVASVSDTIPLLTRPRSPTPSDGNFEGDSSYSFEPDVDATKEEIEESIREVRGLGEEIKAAVGDIMRHPNAEELMRLMLEQSNCTIS